MDKNIFHDEYNNTYSIWYHKYHFVKLTKFKWFDFILL